MKFYEVQKALEEGKKIRRTSWNHGSYLFLGTKEQYGKNVLVYNVLTSNQASSGVYDINVNEIFADDWEIIEDLQEAKVQITISETYKCPLCGASDEYWSSQKDHFEKFGYFLCGRCGQKLKPSMQTDEEVCTYIKNETGRTFSVSLYEKTLMALVQNIPEAITLVNNGKIAKYKRVYP